MAHITCFVCLVSTVLAAAKMSLEEAALVGHITKLEQSTFL
jgi:hypothetical protein